MSADAIPGAFNIVQRQQNDLFESRMKMERFLNQLENHDLPEEVCVLEFIRVFTEENLQERFSALIDVHRDWLSQRGFTIQFVVDELDTVGRQEVETNGSYYPVEEIFDGKFREQERGTWVFSKI
jgi:hypothetical protein